MFKLTLTIDSLDGSEFKTADIRSLVEVFRQATYDKFDNKAVLLEAYVEETIRVG